MIKPKLTEYEKEVQGYIQTLQSALENAGELVTVETVGRDNFRNNPHANRAVSAEMPRDAFIRYLLEALEAQVQARIDDSLLSTKPVFIHICPICQGKEK